ncbi:MAG TPA: AMP-binding protein, partial [Candidatus Polarisedimenticolaceae bacterium]|nr:AMP-binding protein [Candidatus Polarisedimenticolaceae bacterium]
MPHAGPRPDHPHESFPERALDGTIDARFAAIVARHGERTAVEDGARSLSFRDLDQAAARVAAALAAARGPAGDDSRPVALLLEQGADFISALIGVLRAGRFAVPLDPRNPASRNRLILGDSTATAIVASARTSELARALSAGVPPILLDALREPNQAPKRVDRTADAEAILLYTSGSTGRPKGVIQTHRNLLHNTLRHTNEFRIVPGDRFSLLYPCGVYGGVRDIFNALLNGACL